MYRKIWVDIVGDAIRVVQQKTATKLIIPIHDALRHLLDHQSRARKLTEPVPFL